MVSLGRRETASESVIVGGSNNIIGNIVVNSHDSFIGGGWNNKIGEVDGESVLAGLLLEEVL